MASSKLIFTQGIADGATHRRNVQQNRRKSAKGTPEQPCSIGSSDLPQSFLTLGCELNSSPSKNGLRDIPVTNPILNTLLRTIALEIASMLKVELHRAPSPQLQPALLCVKQAAVYLGRSEQAVQHLIFQKDLPVVRIGRRVHLDRRDLDAWIEKNKY
jgi:excisionase family DNA binding protein